MPKGKSIQIEQLVKGSLASTLIKGNTRAIKQALLDGGAKWNDKLVCWQYMGKELPESIRTAIADVLGEGGALVEAPRQPLGDRGALANAVMEEYLETLPETTPKPEPFTTQEKVSSGLYNTVYATQEINYGFGEHIIKAGTKGAVYAGGSGRVGVMFEGWDKVVMCDWEQVTTDEPEQKYEFKVGDYVRHKTHKDVKGQIDKIEQSKIPPGSQIVNHYSLTYPGMPPTAKILCRYEELELDPDAPKLETIEGGICFDCKVLTRKPLFIREGKARCAECDAKFVEGDLLRQPAAVVIDMTKAEGDPETLAKQADDLAASLGYTHVKSIPYGKPVKTKTSLKLGQFVKHKVLPAATGVIGSIYGETAMVNVSSPNSKDSDFTANQYRLIDLEARDYDLPMRQIEFLQAIRDHQPVKKNAATRAALRRYGMITANADWDKIELTPAGSGWLENFGPGSPQVATPELEDFTTYTIEAAHGVQQGDDWMGWITCYKCGAYIDSHKNREALGPAADTLVEVIGLGCICDACDEARTPIPVAKQDHLNAIPERIKGVKKGGKVYAAEDIHADGQVIVHRGCVGRVISQGTGGLNVKFTEHQHIVLCFWDMVSADPLPEAPASAPDNPALALNQDNTSQVSANSENPVKTLSARPGWETRAVSIVTDGASQSVEAEVFGQLAVHGKWLGRGFTPHQFVLSHIQSGRCIPISLEKPTKESLYELAESLASIDIDAWAKALIDGDKEAARAGQDATAAAVQAWEAKYKKQSWIESHPDVDPAIAEAI